MSIVEGHDPGYVNDVHARTLRANGWEHRGNDVWRHPHLPNAIQVDRTQAGRGDTWKEYNNIGRAQAGGHDHYTLDKHLKSKTY